MARIYISLGTNVEPERHVISGVADLRRHLGELQLSRVFESKAVGFDGTNFLNMVIGADTDLSIADVNALFKQIEQDNGRQVQAKKFSPRSLDLDLLLYDDEVCQQPIILPRGEILYNAFVLWPLAELIPDARHPLTQKTYLRLWDEFDKQSQHIWPTAFDFPQPEP
jgi:2-amino-4-hydroxy-6-hydroxymethyldihydropteridine diphosphokinase